MSRLSPLRLCTTTGLALGTAAVGIALAPTALAAPAATLSATTVAPGGEFTVSGTGCLPIEGKDVVAVILPAVDPQWADTTEPAADGSWSFTMEAPTELGAYEFALLCDQYDDGFEYANVTVTVTADGKPVRSAGPSTPAAAPTTVAPTGVIRGTSANTPGVASPDTGAATGDRAAPGQKVVKVLTGFRPGEVVTVTLHSAPQRVASGTADASGTVRIEFTVPAGTPTGDHTLVYEGNRGTYFQEAFAVTASGDSAASLAYTGASVALPLGLGAGALALGGGLVFFGRRRAAEATQA
ncbi:hypothetical protein [Geodermatophilus amargosae]|uniref:hypothetical protein n=1 Tax=Geodermatophilus amargosae TaxID=1296565 RepID=UPI0034DF016D